MLPLFLNRGVTTADFHSSGIVFVTRQKLKRLVYIGIRISGISFKIFGWIPETPGAEEEDSFSKIIFTSTSDTLEKLKPSSLVSKIFSFFKLLK